MEVSLAEEFERTLADLMRAHAFGSVEIVSHGVRRMRGALALNVTIDREGGVDFATCERLARAINARLDRFPKDYTLEVESAGLNRRLTAPGDYERFSGRAAKVVTSLAVYGGKTHRGVLRGVRGTNVILETSSGELPLPLAAIKSANLEYDVRADLERAKKAGN